MRNDFTDITILLDRSGSMGTICNDTIGGFNSFVKEQQAVPGEACLTLVQFDNEYEVNYEAVKLSNVEKLTDSTYRPRGTTALLDALGKTIVRTGERLSAMKEEDRPGKVIFVTITDGEENASKEYKKDVIAKMVKVQQESFSWNFVFLGANMDSFTEARGMNLYAGNVVNYSATGDGVQKAFKTAARGMTSYRAGGQCVTDSFFAGSSHADDVVSGSPDDKLSPANDKTV